MTGKFLTIVGGAAVLALGACGRAASREPGSIAQSTGATTTVAPEANRGGPMTIDELLRGRVAGMQIVALPEGGYSYKIRGTEGMAEPLFLVDGIEIHPRQLEGALAGLTRDDIRKVEVLKDLASTAMYGMKGAGGVVLITTKKR
jgi:TonB-dependent SusC/RagA subfamily outer membrane receptor